MRTKSSLFFAIVAAIMLALEKGVDSIITNVFLLEGVGVLTAVSSYIIVGAWAGVLVAVLLYKVFDKPLRKLEVVNYTGINVLNGLNKASLISGVSGALFTFTFLLGLRVLDLQVMYALTTAYVIFVVVFEYLRGYVKNIKAYVVPVSLIAIGSILSAYDNEWLAYEIRDNTITFMIMVFVFYNLFFAVNELAEKKAISSSEGDVLNVVLARSIILAISASILAIGLSVWREKQNELLEAVIFLATNPVALGFLTLLFFFVTVGIAAKLAAKAMSKDVSKVLLVVMGHLVIGWFVVLGLRFLWPETVPAIPDQPLEIGIRILASILLFYGVWQTGKMYEKVPEEDAPENAST